MLNTGAPRALAADDVPDCRALLLEVFDGTPYLDRALEVLELARAGGVEHRALVVDANANLCALVIFGETAGSDAGRLHVVALRDGVAEPGDASRLLDAVAKELRNRGARFVLAELPEDPAVPLSIGLLLHSGFVQEARIPDLFRDGVALVFLRKDL